jgi:hypothetical protein
MARYEGWASVTGGLIELSTLLCEAALSGRFLINWNVLKNINPYLEMYIFLLVMFMKYINCWRQLCHLHIDSSPYDHITILGPSAASLELC